MIVWTLVNHAQFVVAFLLWMTANYCKYTKRIANHIGFSSKSGIALLNPCLRESLYCHPNKAITNQSKWSNICIFKWSYLKSIFLRPYLLPCSFNTRQPKSRCWTFKLHESFSYYSCFGKWTTTFCLTDAVRWSVISIDLREIILSMLWWSSTLDILKIISTSTS